MKCGHAARLGALAAAASQCAATAREPAGQQSSPATATRRSPRPAPY